MRNSGRLFIALGLAGLYGGLAVAQEIPPPAPTQAQREAAAAREEPPPAPGEGPAIAPAAPPAVAPPVVITPVPQTADVPVKPAAPAVRARYPIAIVQVVDKITTETNRFEVRVDHPVQYKSLIFTLHACEASAPDELDRDFIAHMDVDFQPATPEGHPAPARQAVFKGWMYASSPSISPLEHPVYDAWLISCKTDAPPPSAGALKSPPPLRADPSSAR